MKQEIPLPREIVSWASEVKKRLDLEVPMAAEDGQDVRLPKGLYDELFETLDLLQQASEGNAVASPRMGESGDAQLMDLIDESLARWQANISVEYAQASTKELSHYLQQSQELLTALEKRESRIAEQEQALEIQLAEALATQAKLKRQRQTVAKELRARKAEGLLEVEQRWHALAQESDARANNDAAAELEQLKEELARVTAELTELKRKLDGANQQHDHLRQQLAEAQAADSPNAEHLEEELLTLRALVAELEQAGESANLQQQRSCESSEQQQRELDALRDQLEHAQLRIAQFEEQAEVIASTSVEQEALELSRLLDESREENEDLRGQNADLALQLAKRQVSGATLPHPGSDQESMSWEERKKLIMQQLEYDDHNDGDADATRENRAQIERVLATTQAEIARRDREIEGLQAILELQADTKQGVAIGAAAIAQMLDSDELVQQERLKLKAIQQEWEEKLRRAEIDVSMERAKLARERTQLEFELAELRHHESTTPPATTANEAGTGRTRKWLEHLGLKDDSGKQ